MCRAQERWTEAFPLVLGMRMAIKEDLQASVLKLVYVEPLRIPGELLEAPPTTGDPSELITQLRRHFEHLRPVPAARHASPAVFIHKDLADSTHVFLWQDAVWRPLEPPYSGPYKVLACTLKMIQIAINGQPVTVSTDSVKPAFITGETDGHTATARASPEQATQNRTTVEHTRPSSHADHTFRSPRPFSGTVQRLSILLRLAG